WPLFSTTHGRELSTRKCTGLRPDLGGSPQADADHNMTRPADSKARWIRRIVYPTVVVAVALLLSMHSSENEQPKQAKSIPHTYMKASANLPDDYPKPGSPRWKVNFTPEQWRQRLTPEQFHVLRHEGT